MEDENFPVEVIIITVYSLLAATGFFGNTWVLLKILSQQCGCRKRPQRPYKTVVQQSAYIYICVLSIVDLTSLLPVPMVVTDIYENHFPFGNGACKFLWFCEGMNKTLSPMILVALSIDRYFAVCHPTVHWMRQYKFAFVVLLTCTSISFMFVVPAVSGAMIQPMTDQKGREVLKCAMHQEASISFDLLHTLIFYVLPLFTICAVYLAILHKLFIHTRFSTVGNKTAISLSRVVKCSVMVVAFYFCCWTPYWGIRIQYLYETIFHHTDASENATIILDNTITPPVEDESNGFLDLINIFKLISDERQHNLKIAAIYLVHALPYAQSAFNWLFYAFLNRNLKSNNKASHHNGTRSAVTNSAIDNGQATSTMNTASMTPLWRNITNMGTHIKTASSETRTALMKKSPFKGKSKIQSRSAAYLDCSGHMLNPSSENTLSSSLLDIPRRPSLIPRQETSLVGKALSFTSIPQPHYQLIDQKDESSNGDVSESSSVEWL